HCPALRYRDGPDRALHSFPTRRSSDLSFGRSATFWPNRRSTARDTERPGRDCAGKAFARASVGSSGSCGRTASLLPRGQVECLRSEEHTSELQSRENLVCRLLLEKKNY